MYVLASTDGTHGSDRLLNISADSDVPVLASIDGSRGSVRIPGISTDSDEKYDQIWNLEFPKAPDSSK